MDWRVETFGPVMQYLHSHSNLFTSFSSIHPLRAPIAHLSGISTSALVVVAVSKLATGVFPNDRILSRQNLHLDIPLSGGLHCDDHGANWTPVLGWDLRGALAVTLIRLRP